MGVPGCQRQNHRSLKKITMANEQHVGIYVEVSKVILLMIHAKLNVYSELLLTNLYVGPLIQNSWSMTDI